MVRALGIDEGENPGILLVDKEGNERMEMFLSEGRIPGFVMRDQKGEVKAQLVLNHGNRPELSLWGLGSSFELTLDSSDGFSSAVLRRDTIGSITLSLDRNNDAIGITLRDKKGNDRADLWTEPIGGTTLRFDDGIVDLHKDGLKIDGRKVVMDESSRARPQIKDGKSNKKKNAQSSSKKPKRKPK